MTPAIAWPQWRGPNRDGRVAELPPLLPKSPKLLWKRPLSSQGLGGIAGTRTDIFLADRELNDTTDVLRCLNIADGKERWAVRYPAPGDLDFGNSSRSTPLLHQDLVIFTGAHGHVTAVNTATGKRAWQINLRTAFGFEEKLPWGYCGSPLIVDGKLILMPGAKDASLVAVDPRSGETIWKTAGNPPSYGSLIVASLGGRTQIIGHDESTLGGWDPTTGKRLWTLKPPRAKDFNVPTPIVVDGRLLVTTENNGTRLYDFRPDGTMKPEPIARNEELSPDASSPVVVGRRVFGVWNKLYCLDLDKGLAPLWMSDDGAFTEYAALVASAERVLIITWTGELILLAADAPKFAPLSRVQLLKDETSLMSHPAFVEERMFIRGSDAVYGFDLT